MQKLPFIGGENARDDIKGDQPFLSFRIAIDRESNADTPEHDFSLAPAQIEQIRLDGFQPAGEFGIGWPNCAAGVRASRHLVEHAGRPPHSDVDEEMLSNLRAKGT